MVMKVFGVLVQIRNVTLYSMAGRYRLYCCCSYLAGNSVSEVEMRKREGCFVDHCLVQEVV